MAAETGRKRLGGPIQSEGLRKNLLQVTAHYKIPPVIYEIPTNKQSNEKKG
jgi:hypothetical protein